MRAKRFIWAVVAAMTATLSACNTSDITNIEINHFWLGTGVDTTSSGCIVVVSAFATSPVGSGGVSLAAVGDTLRVVASASGTCVTSQSFTWETANASVVTVASVNPTTGRLTGISVGATNVTIVHTQTGARVPFSVTVGGGTGGGVSSITFTSSAGSSLARPVGAVDTLTALCTWRSDLPVDCLPEWSSSSSGRITVLGTDSTFVQGAWRRVGRRAIITYRSATTPGETVGVCTTWLRTIAAPIYCEPRTVTP